jgi:aminoglycoside phosphotransferase family enzyme/predicted kinase
MSAAMIRDLIAELRAHAEQRSDIRAIELIETHISWVLLGPEVYKIKKPVRLPFVDFTSYEVRERACRTEVRINRRLAPHTYTGVVPIRKRPDGRFTFECGGNVVEWAVAMKRLDESRRADVLVQNGELGPAHIDALADALARFHGSADRGDEISACGAADVVEKNVSDNFVDLHASAEGIVSPDVLAEIERWQREFLEERRALFASRIERGAICDGHGDLRLEHVFFGDTPEAFEIIDGVEFSDRFRYADVCADIAFLAMDLSRFGRVDLAERLVARYARERADYDLYRLLDFYESYRACVRAKIAAAMASAPSSTEALAESARADARRYLLLADSVRRRSLLAPVLVVVAGSIATGKSTLAERLGEELSAAVISADRTRKDMLGLAPTTHANAGAWTGAYDPAFSQRVYREVLERADAVLASGRPVILDASFRTRAARDEARELARAHGVPLRVFECVVPIDVARRRLAQRDPTKSVSDATPAILDSFAENFEPIHELDAAEHAVIDTAGSPEAAFAEAIRRLPVWPRGLSA